jgi:ABC-2 type transport system ATP-binding protein
MPPSGNPSGLSVLNISKAFDGFQAVDGVSLTVDPGSIFGLLGPNGAGKTTTIRMIMGILGVDSGEIIYRGAPVTRLANREFGYLPEERGLYQKSKLHETLVYLAQLKGLSHTAAGSRVTGLLERMGLGAFAQEPVEVLSKGNQQKAQFIVAVVNRPGVLILDEPFSGLDPMNQQVLKEIIAERCEDGAAVLLSTHQLDQAEKLCGSIALIDKGKVVLSGPLAEVKAQYGEQSVEVAFDGPVPEGITAWLDAVQSDGSTVRGLPRKTPGETLQGLASLGTVEEFKLLAPSLEDIYMRTVKGAGG